MTSLVIVLFEYIFWTSISARSILDLVNINAWVYKTFWPGFAVIVIAVLDVLPNPFRDGVIVWLQYGFRILRIYCKPMSFRKNGSYLNQIVRMTNSKSLTLSYGVRQRKHSSIKDIGKWISGYTGHE